VAIFASLFALIGRFVGRVLTTTLGWASILLFGRVPQDRQVWLAVLTFGSLAWVAAAAGILVPAAGAFLLTALPLPDWIQQDLVRLVMLAIAVLLPAILGGISLLVADPADRPHGRELAETIAKGYLLAPALAGTLVILAVAGTARKLDSAVHRRTDAHIAVVVRPGRYAALVDDLDRALRRAGLVARRRPGSRVLTVPARMLAAIAGAGIRRLVPDALIELVGPDIVVSVYPADLAMTGKKDAVARARAVISRDIRSVDAWFTTTREAQELEDRLAALEPAGPSRPTVATPTAGDLDPIDRRLLELTISQEEWEVLYRRRLQLVTIGHHDLAEEGRRPRPPRPARRAGDDRRLSLATVVGLATVALVALDLVLAARSGDRAGPRAGHASRRRVA
jgi:hypothetical protein